MPVQFKTDSDHDKVFSAYFDWADKMAIQFPGRETAISYDFRRLQIPVGSGNHDVPVRFPDFNKMRRPVFVEAVDDRDFDTFIGELTTATAPYGGFWFDPLEREINSEPSTEFPATAVIYIPMLWETDVKQPVFEALEKHCRILQMGSWLSLNSKAGGIFQVRAEQKFDKADGTVFGIIDDGIGFLNHRLRKGEVSRVAGLWIQTLALQEQDSSVQRGHIFNSDEIQGLVRQSNNMCEDEVYRGLRAKYKSLEYGLPLGLDRTVEQSVSHGSFILDAAAGAHPVERSGHPEEKMDKVLRETRILAVQLPPQAVDDTAGLHLEIPAIDGLRWMIFAAEKMKRKCERLKLVVNLSYGLVAGAKDGSRFIEQMIEREVERAKEIGVDLEVVMPFGNDYRTRLVGVADVAPNKPSEFELVLPRADQTVSYVEFHAIHDKPEANRSYKRDTGILAGQTFRLMAPGSSGYIETKIPDPGSSVAIKRDGLEVGRLYHVRKHDMRSGKPPVGAHLVLAFAPTDAVANTSATTPSFGLAPAGRWKVRLELAKRAKLAVMAQRDDTVIGYHRQGHQAVLDEERALEWNPQFRDYTGYEGPFVTHAGTNSAYTSGEKVDANGKKRGRIVVASARRFGRKNPEIDAADYSSEGAKWSGRGPDCSMVVETSPVLRGWRASGTRTGSAVHLSGTSVAAARKSRQLLLEHGGSTSATPPRYQWTDNDRKLRLGAETWEDDVLRPTRKRG